jgi:hypothetical protein
MRWAYFDETKAWRAIWPAPAKSGRGGESAGPSKKLENRSLKNGVEASKMRVMCFYQGDKKEAKVLSTG